MKKFAVAAIAALAIASAADATVLDLSGLPEGEITTPVTVGDFTISPSGGLSVNPVIALVGGRKVLLSTNSTYGDDAILSRTDGGTFTLNSVTIGTQDGTYTGQGIGASNGANSDLNGYVGSTPITLDFGDLYKDVTWVDLNGLSYAYYDNIDVTATGEVPEPASWAMMVGGFGLLGGALRRRKAAVSFA